MTDDGSRKLCECGCGTEMVELDSRGRKRRFLYGHSLRTATRPPRNIGVTPCIIEGCENVQQGRGYCMKHYHRLLRTGDPLSPGTKDSIDMRFWRKVQKSDGCWWWISVRNEDGYGQFRNDELGRMEGAHRFSWRLTHGDIPHGMCVLHHCDNPPCVNPDHLFLGTQQDNIADMHAKGRYVKRGQKV